MKRRICIVTGSRAEYGLLRWVMEGIRDSADLELQLAVTGMHLASGFGSTYRAIESDGFRIDRRIEMSLESDAPVDLTRALGAATAGFGSALEDLDPHVLVVLGDRFEILAAASAALLARIPVAHIHGGEASEGAYDEAIRHAVTKMSHLHFVAADEYRDRVVQLGESPDRVFVVGGLGVDSIRRLELLGRDELEASLGFPLAAKNLLVTFHPATLEEGAAAGQMAELLAALAELSDTRIIFTMPNADAESHGVWRMIGDFVRKNSAARAVASLGQLRYLSCIAHVDGVVGNSSSGLIEAPALKKGTVNIGDRQKGRLRAGSVIDCAAERSAISAAFARLYSPEFQRLLAGVRNPYGEGGASERVVEVLRSYPLEGILKKTFHDLPR